MKKVKIISICLTMILLFTACDGKDNSNDTPLNNDITLENNGQCLHDWIPEDCENPKICKLCGEKSGVMRGHSYANATCQIPATCRHCGKESGGTLSHFWKPATCVSPKICETCNEESGKALGHKWVEATCDKPKTCSACNKVEGEKVEHQWEEANCEKPKTCKLCEKTDGEKLKHKGGEASCDKKAICELCKKEYGELKEHIWQEATCITAKTCSICKKTDGKEKGHTGFKVLCTDNINCTTCGMAYLKGEPHTLTAISSTEKKCDKCEYKEFYSSIVQCPTCQESYDSFVVKEHICKVCSHNWTEATCTTLKTCSLCGKTEGEFAAHKINLVSCKDGAICQVCNTMQIQPKEHEMEQINATTKRCKNCNHQVVIQQEDIICSACQNTYASQTEYDNHNCTVNNIENLQF